MSPARRVRPAVGGDVPERQRGRSASAARHLQPPLRARDDHEVKVLRAGCGGRRKG